jgi:hypothetical protein
MVPAVGATGMRMPGMMFGGVKPAEPPAAAAAGPGHRAVAAAASLTVLYTTDAGGSIDD